jgi:hypothetical protein
MTAAPKQFYLKATISQKIEIAVSANIVDLMSERVNIGELELRLYAGYYYALDPETGYIFRFEYSEECQTMTLTSDLITIYVDFSKMVCYLNFCDSKNFKTIVSIGVAELRI